MSLSQIRPTAQELIAAITAINIEVAVNIIGNALSIIALEVMFGTVLNATTITNYQVN